MAEDKDRFDYDYVIIGSGFGGSVSALRLSEKGYKVLVVEKGKWYKKEDFPKTNWDLKKWLWLPPFKMFGILKMTILRHVTIISGVGVGGGSLVYANTLPIPKSEFFNSGNWKGLTDWEAELKPHYAVAEKMLGATENPKFYDSDIALQKVAQQMGRSNKFEAPKVSVFFGRSDVEVKDPFFNGEGPDRVGCNFCGQCMTGCPNNAKNSLDKNYLYLAQNKGAKIIAEKLVTSVKPIDHKNSNKGYIVDFKDATSYFNKGLGTVKTKGVIFSGGVLGTVRLMLNMKSKKILPNLSEDVGNHIRTNNENLSLITTRDKDLDLSKGIAIGSIFSPDDDGHVEAVRYGAGSNFWKILIIPMVFGKNVFIRIFQLLKELIFHPSVWIGNYLRKDYAKRTVILLFMQHLDSTIKFKKGWFNLSSKVTSGSKPTPFIPMAKTLADKVAKEINGNAFMMSTDIIFGSPSTAHILGGSVIGKDSSKGVIDTEQKVFGYENMYVCDGSAISANPGVNPSLSITAMTERAMSFIPSKNI